MKILYISYDGLTDALGQSQILPYLKGCSGSHDITVLSVEKKEALVRRQGFIQKEMDSHGLAWHYLSYTKNPPLLSTLYDIRRMMRSGKKLIQTGEIEIIHCRSYVAAYVAFRLKRIFGVKVLFDMRGFWADERLEGRIWKASNPVHRYLYLLLKKREKQWLLRADHVVTLTEAAKQEACHVIQPAAQAEKISVVPCCVDTVSFDPANISRSETDRCRQVLGLKPGQRVLCYLGSLGTWYLAGEMLLQFKNLRDRGLIDHFVCLTNDSRDLTDMISRMALPAGTITIRSAERHEIPAFLSAIDIGIFYIRNTYSKRASSPTKLGEFLAMGKPVICNPIGDLSTFFTKNEVGICRPPQNELDHNDMQQLLSCSSEKIRETAVRELGLATGTKRYQKIYNGLSEKA